MATVGMDWGLVALGVTATVREVGEVVVATGELAARYGEHAVITTGSFADDRAHASAVDQPVILIASSESFLVSAPIAAIELDSREESIGVIHAIHGVNADGEWFLLADFADGLTRAGDPAPLAPSSTQPERLVILSDRELAVASLPPPET